MEATLAQNEKPEPPQHHEKVTDVITEAPMSKGIGIEPGDVRVATSKSKQERALVRKMDILILPLLSGAIFFAYLVSL